MMRRFGFVYFLIRNRLLPFLNRFEQRIGWLVRKGLPGERSRAFGVMLIVIMVASSSPSAPQSAARLSKEWGAVEWRADIHAKVYRGFANGYGRLERLAETLISRVSKTAGPAEYSEHSSAAYANEFAMLVLNAPTNVGLSSTSATSINLTWTAPSGTVSYYQIERSPSLSGPFDVIDTATSASYNDTSITSGIAYLYRVRAVDTFGAPSPPSTMALGTAITFTDDPLVAGTTTIKAQHLIQLRQSVNAVRSAADLSAATWTDTTLAGVSIKAVHVQELRDRLAEGLAELDIASGAYTDPSLTAGTTLIKKAHVEELRLRSTRGSSSSTGILFGPGDLAKARLDPINRTGGGGEDPLSRNFNWSLSLLGLSGRAGLNLGLSLSYNSLVWTKSGSSISFNDDGGFPSAGFRLGFPVIQPLYFNSEVGKNAFLLISPDGSRTELRQVGSSALYEAADSSYLLLDSATMILKTTDGTQLSYGWEGSDYQCSQIKDRNGNFITINYTAFGAIDTVVDTLARTVKFNYDGTNALTSITQTWTVSGAPVTHTWATFTYSNLTISTNFNGLTNVGPQNGAIIKVLTRVTLDDSSRFDFDYTTWGQVWKIRSYAADAHLLNYRSYNLPLNNSTAQSDCPRFTERRDWAENWNRSGPVGAALLPAGAEQEVVTTYAVPASTSWTLPDGTPQTGMRAQVTLPDDTYHKIYFAGSAGTASGWQRGLPSLVETYDSGNTRQRQSVTTWTQDNVSVSYPLNPRVTETNVYDPAGNRARKRVTYQAVGLPDGTSCNLPQDIYEYQANAATVLRRTHAAYNLTTTYTSRRIIGLVSEQTLYEVDPNTLAETLMSKAGFTYDGAGSIQGTAAPVQHDNTSYTASFVAGRGNLSSVKRYDITNLVLFTTSNVKYNTAGAVVAMIDPLSHEVTVSYADSFSDGNNARNTHAYPTTITDADDFSSVSQYNFDFGAVTRVQGPPPAGQTTGAIKHFTYDSVARIQKVATEFNGNANYSYTRFAYPTSHNRVDTYATIVAGLGEAHAFQISDGHGRTFASASDHPGSVGGFSGQLTLFNTIGRAVKTSNPTETNASGAPLEWIAAGDDATAGWLYTQQTYDWKGRSRITTNTDGTTKEASYAGCGCAGGEVVTVTDEGTIDAGVSKRRQQKVYSDILGRTIKIETLNWQGGSVYSTNTIKYNARDQVTLVRQYAGPEGSATYQDTSTTYDGHGRLKTKHRPEQVANGVTTFNYNPDDTVSSMTDARGASQTFSYNSRHSVTGISYAAPSGISVPDAVSFGYDAVRNRTTMLDGSGETSYQYNQLSQIQSETREFDGLTGGRTLSYEYNLAGDLKKISDPTNVSISYAYDVVGRLNNVSGTDTLYAGVSQYASGVAYRAWGGIKGLTYGNNYTLSLSYNARLRGTQFEIAGRPAQFGASTVMKAQFDYYADGAVRYAQDLLDERFDRAFSYDHVAMFKEAYSGSESRDFVNGTNSGTQTGPFRQSYQYDAFGNMTHRDNRVWSHTDSFTDSYTNYRKAGFIYDADGRLVQDENLQYGYDASGRNVSIHNLEQGRTITSVHDGDGKITKRIEAEGTNTVTTYFLRSTVLEGRTITELDQSGQKTKGYVFAGARLLAEQQNNAVSWRHESPLTGSRGSSFSDGRYKREFEPDPMGVNVGLFDPFMFDPPDPPSPDLMMPMLTGDTGSCGGNPNCTTCTLDGMDISCDQALRLMDIGAVDLQVTRTDGSRVIVPIQSFGVGIFRVWVPNSSYTDHPGIHPGIDPETGKPIDVASGTLNDGGRWETFSFDYTPQNSQRDRHHPEPGDQDRLKGVTGGANALPCDVAIPTDANDKAVLATLMGEAMYPGARVYTHATNDGRGNSNYEQVKHPDGYAQDHEVYMEMEYMVSVFINRQRDWGYASWYDVANAKQKKNGKYQMEGYPAGLAALNNLGAVGDDTCEQARRAMRAIENVKSHGPVNESIHNWRGVLQQPKNEPPFVRVRQGAIRIAGTDFW